MVKTLMILKMVLMMTVIWVRASYNAKVLAIMLMTNMEMMVKTVMAHKSTKLDFGDNEVLKPIFCQIIHLINLFKSKSQLPLCDAWGHCRSWHQVYQATSTGSVNLNTNHFRSMPTSNLNPKLAWDFRSIWAWTGTCRPFSLHSRSISLHHVGHDQLHNAGHDQTDSLTKKGSGSLGEQGA